MKFSGCKRTRVEENRAGVVGKVIKQISRRDTGENETQVIVWKLVRKTTERRELSVIESKMKNPSLA